MKKLNEMTTEELGLFLDKEINRHVNRTFFTSTSYFEKSDLSSYLGVRIYEYILKYDSTKNQNGQAYVRGLLKNFTLNFFKSPSNINVTAVQTEKVMDYITGDIITKEDALARGLDLTLCETIYTSGHNVSNFSQFEDEDEDGDACNFEEGNNFGGYTSVSSTAVDGIMIHSFLDTLPLRQRVIIELKAGILSSLSAEEYSIAKDILMDKSSKKSGEVYLSNSDIASIIGIGRVKVQNHLSKIAEKALDFGLEELY